MNNDDIDSFNLMNAFTLKSIQLSDRALLYTNDKTMHLEEYEN